MGDGTRKRLRDSVAADALSSTRENLASRVAEATPPFSFHAAASAGVVGTDTFLVHLGRSIAAAIQSLAESAEAARAQLRETRAAVHTSVDARCDELDRTIDSAEAVKAAALERDLVAVDAALDRWRAESSAVYDVISACTDADLILRHATLSGRLNDLETLLEALPTAANPPIVALAVRTRELLSSIGGFGFVATPLLVTAADLSLKSIPNTRGVRLGDTLRLRLCLGARHDNQTAEELEVALGRLIETIRIEAILNGASVGSQPLAVTLEPDVSRRCLSVSLAIPFAFCSGPDVKLCAVYVAGEPLAGFPVRVPVHCGGLIAPFVFRFGGAFCTTQPCISPEGRFYCPSGCDGPDVLVFDDIGAPLPGLPVASVGLSNVGVIAAYAHGDVSSLLLADRTCLVNVDPTTHALRWKSVALHCCFGIAAVPSLGIVVVSDLNNLFAHRLSDGIRAGSLASSDNMAFLASDPATGALYGSGSKYRDAGTVYSWSCSSSDEGIRIIKNGYVAAASSVNSSESRGVRPLTVVPPAPGKTVSHLVVCFGADTSADSLPTKLIALSLPTLVLVHTHTLEGLSVQSVAADPWGAAIAVCDYSGTIHVLAWPLPGMLPPE